MVYTPNIDPRGPQNGGGVTKQGVPVMHHVADLPIGLSVDDGVKLVVAFAHAQNIESSTPSFGIFRTILQPAAYHHQVATTASAQAANLEWVDPVTMGMLVKLHVTGSLK